MPRAILIILDSVGCGGARDAVAYGDAGADTLGHIAESCALGRGNRAGLRAGPLRLPNLDFLGLGRAIEASTGRLPPGFTRNVACNSQWGFAIEVSRGKDTPSGHWEIAGTPVDFAWGYFPDTQPCFPADLIEAMIAQGNVPGILGNRHASGTSIVQDLGEEHVRSGKPICYTSVDSVFQIAAHEEAFGLSRLLDFCLVARRLCDPLRIGRVIARPFTGSSAGDFRRTANRKDFAVPPPPGTLLDRASQEGRSIVTIGKIGDIFAHRCTGFEIHAPSTRDLVNETLSALERLSDGGLIFANYVEFDSEFGHRRDIPGYAAALEAFDARVPELTKRLRPGDLAVITADHGNDPTWPGTDHTREHVPILCFGPGLHRCALGARRSFADIGESIARHLGLPPGPNGQSWLLPSQ